MDTNTNAKYMYVNTGLFIKCPNHMVYGILYFICFCILFSFSFYLNLKMYRVLFKQFYVYAKKKILFKNAFKSLILMVLDHKQKQIFRRKQKNKNNV